MREGNPWDSRGRKYGGGQMIIYRTIAVSAATLALSYLATLAPWAYAADTITGLAPVAQNLDSELHPVMSMPSVPARRYFGPVNVPEEQYFIMGDNRDNSKDSRVFGFVDRRVIIGKAKGVVVSFDITDKYQPRTKRFFSSLYQ